MKNILCIGLLVIVVFGSACAVSAKIHEIEAARGGAGLQNVHNKVLCVDGFKVFQTIVFGFKGDGGTGISNIQLMEEKDGNLVPVRCS